jgi:Subtilase family
MDIPTLKSARKQALLPQSRKITNAVATAVAILCGSAVTAASASPQNAALHNEAAKQALRNVLNKHEQAFLIDSGARAFVPIGHPTNQVVGTTLLFVQFENKLSKGDRAALAKAGVTLQRRAGKNAWLAQVTESGAQALDNWPGFRGSEPMVAADKLTANLYHRKNIDHAVGPDGLTTVQVKFLPQVSVGAATTALRTAGVQLTTPDKYRFGNYLEVSLSEQQIEQLAANPGVLLIRERHTPTKDFNANSVAYANADTLQTDPAYMLDGSGVTLGMWESGNPRPTHQEYAGRVVSEEGSTTDHGSHVAGTILAAGIDANALGMAPAAGTLHSYTSAGDPPGEMVDAVNDYGIVISNNSWGAIIGWNWDGMTNVDTGNQGDFGNYTSLSGDWDDIVLATGLIISKAAGNDGNQCNPMNNTDCDGTQGADLQWYGNMGPRAMAKNLISVGAVDSAVAGLNNIAGFSSAGPADDGRIKPDIVADGASLYSSCFNSDSDYCNKGGTSMSTPSVTGATALLVQHYRDHYGPGNEPSVEIMKALLINSAVDHGRAGPDYIYGHGRLDALAAAQVIDEGEIRIISNAVDQDETDEYLMLVPGGMNELRVTMTWLDPSGEVNNTDAVFQDLDLVLEDPAGDLHYPWTGPGTGNVTGPATRSGKNGVDNVEDAEVTNPLQGVWIARVSGNDVGGGAQNYALIANQDFSLPDQPEIEVNFSGDIIGACTGDQIERQIRIFNTGGADLQIHSVAVATGSGGNFSILGTPAQPIIIAAGAHVDYTLRYEPQDPSDDTATLTILSNDVDEGTLELAITGQVGEGNLAATMEGGGAFGDVMALQTAVLNLEVINEGSCDGIVESVQRASGSTDFDVGALGAGLGFPITLGAGSNLAIPINYIPTPPPWGDADATFEMTELGYPGDGTPTVHELDVTGRSSPPVATTSGDGEFGEVCGGDVSERTIEVCNTGELNSYHVFAANIVESGSLQVCDDFEIAGNPFPADISHDFCMPLSIRYTPTEAGSHNCRLHLITNAPSSGDIFVDLNGETPTGSLAALADLTFDPTVIQEIGPGIDQRPLAVVNNGSCPVQINDVSDDSDHYQAIGAPTLPVELLPGEQLGDGALVMAFEPLVLARELEGVVTVTYEEDPITGATNTVAADMCGEGVHTGARVLVTQGGLPVDMVSSIQLLRKVGNTNGKGKAGKTDSVDIAKDVPLSSIAGSGPACPSFDYHMEYGTVANAIQLLPGDYELTVSIPNVSGKGKPQKMTQAFSVTVTDFVHTIVVAF